MKHDTSIKQKVKKFDIEFILESGEHVYSDVAVENPRKTFDEQYVINIISEMTAVRVKTEKGYRVINPRYVKEFIITENTGEKEQ